MHEIYVKTKTYLINEIAEDARGVLSAIEGKDPVAVGWRTTGAVFIETGEDGR